MEEQHGPWTNGNFKRSFTPGLVFNLLVTLVAITVFALRLEARISQNGTELVRHKEALRATQMDIATERELNHKRDIMVGALLQKNGMLSGFYPGNGQ